MERKIPAGDWFYINRLPLGTTDVQLQTFLAEHGIDLELDRISVRQYPNCSSAKISVSRPVVEKLVNWAINGDMILNHPVLAEEVVGVATNR
jgi:hypothetical protein